MKQKLLFIDRDGTIIKEPEDYQIDSFEKFEFLPNVISVLSELITRFNYQLVLVTNQDGLGTASFPESTFWPVQNKMLRILENEGITFLSIHIDKSLEKDNSENRKPNIGMVKDYLKGDYDFERSFMIGDRLTDLIFAKNLGIKGILIAEKESELAVFTSNKYRDILEFIISRQRFSKVIRKTKETDISIELNLDQLGHASINTGLKFLDHMLEQLAKHSGMSLVIKCQGDLQIDEHHSVEDIAISLGKALKEAIGEMPKIERYGFVLPMDDTLASVAIDVSNRFYFNWDVQFKREKVGDLPTELVKHFFYSFAEHAKINLTISCTGENEHHKIESIFKATARALKMALNYNKTNQLPSSKGLL